MPITGRRAFLRHSISGGVTALGLTSLPAWAYAEQGLRLGQAQPFSYRKLIARARERARTEYQAPPRPSPELVQQIDYDAHGQLRYKPSLALNAAQAGAYPVTFFHLGRFFSKSVKMHRVANGQAQEVMYDPALFEMPPTAVARQLQGSVGFAGFRFQESNRRADWQTQDWLAFLGASYFRAIGDQGQYGLSARGLALNTTAADGEEFPDFIEFYIDGAAGAEAPVVVHALLDGPSVTGAFQFKCQRGSGVVMDVDSHVFLRRAVEQLGVAPVTSMFWFAEYDKEFRADWRPEVHDSDGLLLWTGGRERIWRPLNSPSRVITSSFFDNNPRGFGLIQRDRCFEHYLDGVNYQQRPSLWVEPRTGWGRGRVQLIEIPTHDEYHDNIVAFWVPEEPARRGAHFHHRYRLHWQALAPIPSLKRAHVMGTRIGRLPEADSTEGKVTRFVVEFAGPGLAGGEMPEARLSSTRGRISGQLLEWLPHGRGLRVQFDLGAPSKQTLELRAELLRDGEVCSETWAHQYETR